MVWFYRRKAQALTLETRFENATGEYVATVTGRGGPPMTVRFASSEAFRDWLLAQERELLAEQWTADGAHVLPDGWRHAPWKL